MTPFVKFMLQWNLIPVDAEINPTVANEVSVAIKSFSSSWLNASWAMTEALGVALAHSQCPDPCKPDFQRSGLGLRTRCRGHVLFQSRILPSGGFWSYNSQFSEKVFLLMGGGLDEFGGEFQGLHKQPGRLHGSHNSHLAWSWCHLHVQRKHADMENCLSVKANITG